MAASGDHRCYGSDYLICHDIHSPSFAAATVIFCASSVSGDQKRTTSNHDSVSDRIETAVILLVVLIINYVLLLLFDLFCGVSADRVRQF